jgi:NADPH2:quinone reductase
LRKGRVVATVNSEKQLKEAQSVLSDNIELLNIKADDFVKNVRTFTENQGISVIYDDIGKENYKQNIEVMANFALYCMYGAAAHSMKSDSFYLVSKEIYKKSGFLTFPSIFHYKANRNELVICAADFFQLIIDGHFKPLKPQTFPLSHYEEAINIVEQGALYPVILIP